MEQKNHGVLVTTPHTTDYIFGSTASIQITRYVDDWFPLLPGTVSQRNSVQDFLDCVTMSGIHAIEANLNYLLSTSQLSDEAMNFFKDNGYITVGKFKLSHRFNAKMNGTDINHGQYLNVAADCFRRDGFVPEIDWPMTDKMTWDDFYAPVPQTIRDKAKKALQYISMQYQFIDRANIPLALKTAPIQIATEICAGWDSGEIVKKCSGQPLQHATIIFGMSADGVYFNMDHYQPYFQKLAADYELPLNMQYVVSMKPITLRRGMQGSNVKKMQEDLQRILGLKIYNDGDFGLNTEAAVRIFQSRNSLVVDGIAGPLTLGKIASMDKEPESIKDLINRVSAQEGIDYALCVAVATCESSLDPKCTNYNKDKVKSVDRGLFQFNSYWHPDISESDAYDPETATRLFCKIAKNAGLSDWRYSQPCWSQKVDPSILKKYGISE